MTSHVTFKQGVKECIPTLLGYVGIGLSFGIVAASQHFSIIEILLLCLLVYAGAAQFIICALVATGTPISAIVLTTLIVNSRFFLLSMTLAPNYKDYGIWNRLGLSSILTDETFGVAITPHLKGEDKRSLVTWIESNCIFILGTSKYCWCVIVNTYLIQIC